MAKTYYETLGVGRQASEVEIKRSYRRLVLKHHPDRSQDPSAPQIFRTISEAYEVLSDSERREKYDWSLGEDKRREEARKEQERKEAERRQREAEAQTAVSYRSEPKPFPATAVKPMLSRLKTLFSRQSFAEAEKLAREIIRVDPRQPMPYAVLGDISRSRGQLEDAARMYSMALQMEPANAVYLRLYEEILDRSQVGSSTGSRVRIQPEEKRIFAIMTIAAVTLLASLYLVMSPERSVLISIGPVSSWTVGLIVMLFLCGVTAGASLSVGNLIDRVDAFSTRRIAPAVAMALIAIVSFPAAAVLYGLVGLIQKSFNITTTRIVLSIAAITACLALAGFLAPAASSVPQTMLWGGNLAYLGAICGWSFADGLRR